MTLSNSGFLDIAAHHSPQLDKPEETPKAISDFVAHVLQVNDWARAA